MADRPFWIWIVSALYLAAFVVTRTNATLGATLGMWGFVILFVGITWRLFREKDREWADAKWELRIGVSTLVAGAVIISAGLLASTNSQLDLTANLLYAVGGTCLVLGFGFELLAFYMSQGF